jgi:hypothetical protein
MKNMKLEDAIKSLDKEVQSNVLKAIKESGAKFVDLSEGQYVDKNKYSDLETKYNELKDAPNPLEAKVKELEESSKTAIQAEKDKLSGVVKKLAIDKEIGQLGITDELTIAGIKSLIKADEIQLDENYNISGGLDNQISTLKEQYKTSFEQPKVVSTGQSVQTSNTVKTNRVYSSLAEIAGLTQAEVDADLANITSQLPNLK